MYDSLYTGQQPIRDVVIVSMELQAVLWYYMYVLVFLFFVDEVHVQCMFLMCLRDKLYWSAT